MSRSGLRPIAEPFVASGRSGAAVRTRLKSLSAADEDVLRRVGAHLGALACRDLRVRCAAGLEHGKGDWAERKRLLTAESSSRWAGAITKASNDQWALARRGQAAYLNELASAVATLRRRLGLAVGQPGARHAPGGYATRQEHFAKQRRLGVLEHRLAKARADWQAGRVRVCRGGKKLARMRHNLDVAGLTTQQWRARWEAARWFLHADGETGKRYGNETIRISPDGEVSIKLPAPLASFANAPHGRYVLSATARFAHRGEEWADRVATDRAVAYTIRLDPQRGRWYVTAAWQPAPAPVASREAAIAAGCVGVDMNADHLAAWQLDSCGNPVGNPQRFGYDLSGTSEHRDAQVRHALTRLLHYTRVYGAKVIAVEDLDFSRDKTRERYGRRKRFRQIISGMPTGKLRDRLVAMAAEAGIAIVAVDPAYTSKWGNRYWRDPLTTNKRNVTGHQAAAVAIGRRALKLRIRRRTGTAPLQPERSQRARTVLAPCQAAKQASQAGSEAARREGTRPHGPGPPTRSAQPGHGANAGDQRAQHRSGHAAVHEKPQSMHSP